MIESLVRDLRFAWRSFARAPLVPLTIIPTVGLGLGLVASVFTVLNAQVFRMDEVRNPRELFAVERQRAAGVETWTLTRADYDALIRETDVFSDAFATRHAEALIEGRRMEGPLVTGNFFHVLGATAARGRTLTPSDDEPGRPPVIVLSHRAWSRHFGSDPGALDRGIRVNGVSFRIVGVMPEGFRGLTWLAPEFWAPLSLAEEFRRTTEGGEEASGLQIVGRLKADLARQQALAILRAWDARRMAELPVAQRPAAGLVLDPRTGTIPLSGETLLPFIPLFFAFGLIGCANVANLLLARGVVRQREIGIRLAIGASRHRIVGQLLTENLLLALGSAALAFGISRVVLTGVVHWLTSTFPADIGHINIAAPQADWRVALFLAGGAMASTLVFALAPALRATRLEVVRAVRGELVRDARPGRARDALVALQVTGSALLLILAAVFLRSAWAAARVDPGFRTAGVVTVTILDEQRRRNVLDVVGNEPFVDALAASYPGFLGGLGGFSGIAAGAGASSPVTYQFVSPEFFDVLGIDLVRGRGFVDTERSAGAAVAIVSETVAQQLWPGSSGVGQVLRLEVDPSSERGPDDPRLLPLTADVIGVARDVAGLRLGDARLGGAGVYLPVSAEAAQTTLTMRVRGDAERARHVLIERLSAIDPNVGQVSTMQTIARAEAYLLGIPFWLTLGLGALALLLTLSGLFGVLSYLVAQRTREIGVRLALGATARSIAALVLSQSARPVAIGLLAGSGLTIALGAALLATPAAALIGATVRLFDPAAYAASLLGIVAACTCAALIPALRAGRIDPIDALRQE